jgi:hypothetical protein
MESNPHSIQSMTSATQLEFPLAKANYLLNYTNTNGAGVGGDKRKFWCEVMGFDNPEWIRENIARFVTAVPDSLGKLQ